MTIRSHGFSRDTRRISGAGLPVVTSNRTSATPWGRDPKVSLEELLHVAHRVVGQVRDAGDLIGLLQQGIVDREKRQPRAEVRRDRRGISKRSTRAVGEVDRAEHGGLEAHGRAPFAVGDDR